MRALQYDRIGGPVRVVEREPPTPTSGGAIVRVTRTGLCRSDWHGWMGHDSDTVLPCIPGHEFTGVVTSAPGRRELVGRRVVVPFVMACGACPECRNGNGQVCRKQRQPGFSEPGSFAEHVAVVAAGVNLVELPDAIDDDAAAALGCRIATSWRALTRVADVQPGESVLVLGAGGVGLAAVQIAVALNAHPIAVDISGAALTLAQSFGATTVRIAEATEAQEVAEQILDAHGGPVDVSVDAVGSADLLAAGILSLRPHGRHVQIGLPGPDRTALPLGRVISRELRLLGSHGMAATDYPPLLDAVIASRLRPARLVSGTVGLDDGAAALMTMGETPPPAGGILLIDPTR